MTKHLLILCCLALLAAPLSAESYVAIMTGDQETPNAGDPDGVGVALVTIEGNTLRYSIVTRNLDTINNAHIHPGERGVAGGVHIGFDINTLANGVIEATTQDAMDRFAAVRANPSRYYVNVHTVTHGPGAIRGQLIPLEGTSPGVQYLPVVGKAGGAAGTNFVTDVRIINRGSTAADVMLEFFPQSTTGTSTPTAMTHVTVAPGAQHVLDDIIGTLGVSGLGALRITSAADVDVRARVINDLRATNQGTSGFSVAAQTLGDIRTSGTLGFLSGSTTEDINAGVGFRTNIGYFNPTSDKPATATFTARSTTDGAVLGTRTITIPGGSFVQQGAFDLINTVPAADIARQNFYVTWETTGAPLFVYAAVVDNETGDSVLIQ